MRFLSTFVITFGVFSAVSLAQENKIQETDSAAIRAAVEKGFPALQQSGPVFFKKSGCISCHHQALPQMVTGMARDRGFHYDEKLADQNLKSILAIMKPAREVLYEGSDVVPQISATGSYILMALAAANYPADDYTTAVVHNMAMRQKPDGSWVGWAPRPPISGGDIRETALSIRGLDLYAPKGRRPEIDARIAQARKWLLQAKPTVAEENIMRLQGLTWAKASPEEIRKVAHEVLAAQRPDGGWSQLETLGSDAYATGEALVALHQAGLLTAKSPAYHRGVQYLMKTQKEDGTWFVKTRAFPFQPLVDTGFPHGRDQWISATGTSWALMALMLTEEPARTLSSSGN